MPVDGVGQRFLQSARQRGVASKFPTPGKTILSARAIAAGSAVIADSYPEMVKRFFYRGKVPGLVVHDGDHSSPLVLGNRRAIRRSRQHAARSARAKALNKDSIL